MTAPYAPEVADLVTRSHAQVVRARAVHPDLPAPLELDLNAEGATYRLSMVETRTPRVMLELTAPLPGDVVELGDALDPRTGVRVEFEAGYVLDDGTEDVAELGDLGLRSRTFRRPAELWDLSTSGDEALVIDAAPTVAGSVSAASTAAGIQAILSQAIAPPPSLTADLAGPAVTVDPIEDRWDSVADLADRVEGRVYDDGTRAWRLAATPTLAAPVHTLTHGQGGTVVELGDTLDRDTWHNYVRVRYEWRDSSGADQVLEATAYVADGPYAVTGPAGKRIMPVTRRVPTTQAEANTAALSILRRALGRARRVTVTAVPAWWIRPGDTVAYRLDASAELTSALVEEITFTPSGMVAELSVPASLDGVALATTTPTASAPVTDPTPPAATKTTYTTTWRANAWATYKGTGAKRTDLGTEVAQGYYGPTNGEQQAVVLFTGTARSSSHASESTKTITQALAGATVSAVKVTLTATHSYYTAGSTARLGYFAGTAIPATYTGAKAYVSSSSWRDGTRRTVTITSSAMIAALLAGTCRGITLGDDTGTLAEYMKFDPSTADLTLTYAR